MCSIFNVLMCGTNGKVLLDDDSGQFLLLYYTTQKLDY